MIFAPTLEMSLWLFSSFLMGFVKLVPTWWICKMEFHFSNSHSKTQALYIKLGMVYHTHSVVKHDQEFLNLRQEFKLYDHRSD